MNIDPDNDDDDSRCSDFRPGADRKKKYYLMYDKMKLSYGLFKDSMRITQDANRIKLKKNKEAVICYMDESYVNTDHHYHYGWYLDSTKRNILNHIGTGKRLIIVHAITSDGLRHKIDSSTDKKIFY